ncbi:uncharacterized protein [Periplaneta americana]|uniref:uncharacterized protein isoform X4 n=1 Tax=Periplaneta americana TaxID=6978 RepID=UPI0037E84B35
MSPSHPVVMDLIKMKLEDDPLDFQANDNINEREENKASSEEENLSHLEVTGMKTECVDHSYEIKSEIKVEHTPVPTSFAFVKCKVDEDFFDWGKVQQEQKVQVSSEEDEVFPESLPPWSNVPTRERFCLPRREKPDERLFNRHSQ